MGPRAVKRGWGKQNVYRAGRKGAKALKAEPSLGCPRCPGPSPTLCFVYPTSGYYGTTPIPYHNPREEEPAILPERVAWQLAQKLCSSKLAIPCHRSTPCRILRPCTKPGTPTRCPWLQTGAGCRQYLGHTKSRSRLRKTLF